MTNAALRLTWRCKVPRCGHRARWGSPFCGPCWRAIPEKEKAGVWAAILTAGAAVSETQEATP